MATINTSNMIPFSPLPASLTWFVCDVENRSQQPGQTAVIAHQPANKPRPTNGQPATGPRPSVQSAESASPNHKNNMPRGIALQSANSGQNNGDTDNDNKPARNGSVSPPNRGFVDPPTVGNCRHCGQPLTRKSRNGRYPKFCGTPCRVAHWRQCQKADK